MSLSSNFVNFCESSTIHGISFWSSAKSISQKVLWIFIVFLGIGSAIFMIWNNFQTWAANPVVVSVVQVPIEQAPYPSVTICPLESTPFGSIESIVDENYQGNVKIQNVARELVRDFIVEMLEYYGEKGLEEFDDCYSSICKNDKYSNTTSCFSVNSIFQNIESRFLKANNDPTFFKSDVLKAIQNNSEFDESKSINESISNNEGICNKIYSYSKHLLQIKYLDLMNDNNLNMKIGTLLSWLYNHVDDLNDDQFSFEMKEKILEVLNPSQIPEVSSRRRFETFDDIFLPDLAQALIGKHNTDSRRNLNIQGIKYTQDLYYMMKYSQSPMEVFQNSGKINPKPGIPFCLFANSNEKGKKIDGYPEKFCKSMQPVMNEDGICYSYNNIDFQLERESNYTDKLENIQGVGHKKGLTLLVDSQMIKNRARKAVSDYEGFKVIVTVPGAIAAKVSFIVEPDFPGEHSFYLHGIHYITASPDVIQWNKDAKVCYFPQNKELTYYNHYLQDNCLQECKLKKISNQCNCSPWFINQTELPICNELGMSCFRDKASNYQDDLKDRTECDCKNDCEMVHFFYSMRQEGYNREWFNPVNKDAILNNYLMDPNNVFQESFTHNLTKLMYSMNDLQIANDRFNRDILILNFFFDTPIISNFKLEMKVTIFDQISAIGGTLGLFAGVSLISMFEIVFWIFKAFIDRTLSLFGFNAKKSRSTEPLNVKEVNTGFRKSVFNPSF